MSITIFIPSNKKIQPDSAKGKYFRNSYICWIFGLFLDFWSFGVMDHFCIFGAFELGTLEFWSLDHSWVFEFLSSGLVLGFWSFGSLLHFFGVFEFWIASAFFRVFEF